MTIRHAFAILASTLLVTAAQAASLTAQQIADRNAAARGGAAAWQRVHGMSMAGRLDAGKVRKDGGLIGENATRTRAQARAQMRAALQNKNTLPEARVIQLPFQMQLERPRKMRLEVPFQGQTAVQVFDGKEGWKLRPYLGRHEVEKFSPEELKLAQGQQELDGALINYASKGTTIALEGTDIIEGHNNFRLKLTMKGGEVRHLWVDAQTFLDTKIDASPRRWDGKMRAVTTYFRDYKPVNGLMIAHRLETRLEGVPGARNIFIEKVALNPGFAANSFTRPM